MKKVHLISIVFILVIHSIYCQTKQESIKELFRVMQQDSLMNKTFAAILPSIIQASNPASKAQSEEIMKYAMEIVQEIALKLINEDMVVIYDRYFTQAEINDFIAFYKSPSGQKIIKSSPDISKDVMNIMMQKYTPEMQKKITAKIEEMKAKDK